LLLLYGFGKTFDNPPIEKNNITMRITAIKIMTSISGEISHPLFFKLYINKYLALNYISFSVVI